MCDHNMMHIMTIHYAHTPVLLVGRKLPDINRFVIPSRPSALTNTKPFVRASLLRRAASGQTPLVFLYSLYASKRGLYQLFSAAGIGQYVCICMYIRVYMKCVVYSI